MRTRFCMLLMAVMVLLVVQCGPVIPPDLPPVPEYLDDAPSANTIVNALQTVARWSKTHLTYSFQGVPEEYEGQLYAAYEQAVRMWSDVAPLSFHQVESGGDIRIWWITAQNGPVIPTELPPIPEEIPARAEFPNDDRPISQVINGLVAPDWSAAFTLRVAAHELGHSLGVYHPDENVVSCGNADSPLMCAWLLDDQRDEVPELRAADIDAVQELYGTPDAPLPIDAAFEDLRDPGDVPPPLDENDPDGDGLDTFTEQLLTWPTGLKCDPEDPDTDDDGLPDGYEVQNLLDPTNVDSDGDGRNDKLEIDEGTDPRSYVVVTEPGSAVVREGTPVCSLPVVEDTTLKVGLTTNDFLRAGFAFGDRVTVTAADADGADSTVDSVSITQWGGENGCAIWMTNELKSALDLSEHSFVELLIEREPDGDDEPVVRITHPEDGDFVPSDTDIIARVRGLDVDDVYVQFFVLAPDPWRYYPQGWDRLDGATAASSTFARAHAFFGGPDDDRRTFTVWAELRSEPVDTVAEGLPGLPPVCESPCLARSPAVLYTRGERDTDGDCISDVDEISNGAVTDAFDSSVPFDTPEPERIGDFERIDDPDVWWWAPEVTTSLDPRDDGATWVRIYWSFDGSDSEWANISRRFALPVQMSYCQRLEADIQALESQRIKVELKIEDGEGGFVWVRTETFSFEAEEYRTVSVDLPESQGCVDLAEVVFTIHRLHDNPESGTYWIRDVRLTGRPTLTCLDDDDETPQPHQRGPCGAIGTLFLPMTMLTMLGMRFRRRR